ncbi:hypothetical protein EDB81DRAFT_44160 [Dactylonectria macrodidyma]|uniref:Uncharacterized protein n=1 Tax=Dactylonectria macrodidyma TaxID=307937 RepID=A0A9P9JJ63_9HYPO|nr:hypothetical protein EDB81DRAFT_44160 [Dactylonectria macrodidyma]
MRAQKIESGFGAFSHLSAANKNLHKILTAYILECQSSFGPQRLGPIIEAINYVIREKPRLPLRASHMSITKVVEDGMVREKTRIVVTAPGGIGYLVVEFPPRDNVDKLDMTQVCNNINDVANRLSPEIWRSLTSYEQRAVLFTAIGGHYGEPLGFVNDQMIVKEKRTLLEIMGVQVCDSPGVTQSHTNQDMVNPRKSFAELRSQVNLLTAKVVDLANALNANNAPAPDLTPRDTAPRDGSDIDDPWANAMLQTTQPRQERPHNQDQYLSNPYLPPGKHAMSRVKSDVSISDSQSQGPAFLDHQMPGSWVPEPMAPSEVEDARDTKRKGKAKTTQPRRQNPCDCGYWSPSNDEASQSASEWDTKSQGQDTWGQEDTSGRKDTWGQGNAFSTGKRHHRRTCDNPIIWDYTQHW